jgi:hypothetical protein
VDQATEKATGIPVDDPSLPRIERNLAFVLPAWSVLGKDMRPVFGIRPNLIQVLAIPAIYGGLAGRHDDGDRRFALSNNERISPVKKDSEPENAPPVARNPAIAEIQTQ